ncbi:MFS transporter [Pseudactinotalea sp. HY158]|nr:MFS transporter [Pseudactinotalea sp. HY158]
MSSSGTTTPDSTHLRNRRVALIMATLGFGVNFWAWALLSPLGPLFVSEGMVSSPALIVAVPVIVGSLGRIPIGALTDRFGGRVMMPLLSIITIVPVLFVGFIGQYTYGTLLVGGFFLGIAGATFSIGVPYVNSWFPPEKRGMATGVYGIGMGGTAISAFVTVPLFKNVGSVAPFVLVAVVLAVYALAAWTMMRNAPTWAPATKSMISQLAHVARIRLTWQACYLYAVAFGGYVAFSVYLPTLLHNWYDVSIGDASLRMAGFVIVAVAMRPLGGILSDRIGATTTLLVGYAVVAVMAIVVIVLHMWQDAPSLIPVGTVGYIGMAAGLGLGSGGVFALIAKRSDPADVGSITGFVGAAGGLGGFVPPLLLGFMWVQRGDYSTGIALLAMATVFAMLVAVWAGQPAAATARPARSAGAPAEETPDSAAEEALS